jgi:glycyl-tRNA synthetase
VDRGFLAILNESYNIEELEDGKQRTVLSFQPHLAPIKAAVIPLKRNNRDLVEKAISLKSSLQNKKLGRVVVENSGNIGKSYRRHDEIGTPLCITIDFQSMDDNTATLRDRDTMEQKRLHLDEIPQYFSEYIGS